MAGIGKELQSTFQSEQQKAMLNVLFTANWFRTIQTSFFKPFGISMQQYNILRILRGSKDPMKMQGVKGRMIDRAPNATRLTDKLITKGLVIRERGNTDKREILVRISPKGMDLLARIDTADHGSALFPVKLNDADAGTLNRILDGWRG
ncbi:MAG: MarR family transcriptional regulator [Flavobacteriales bacterium]|nr:MarR family transcriptional regulator [Flavobacteriales bacterium]